MIILICILGGGVRRELDSSGSGRGPVSGCCEHNNEYSDYKVENSLTEWLSDSTPHN
jgi:hypothetical protein